MTDVVIHIQNPIDAEEVPDPSTLQHWAEVVLHDHRQQAEICLRLIDREESAALNHRFRAKNKATNVLSFPVDLPEGVEDPYLGDIAVCPSVLIEEARAGNISLEQHWAHLFIHGILHLLGYDHIDDDDAETMEALEITLLQQLGYANPYKEANHHE